jgi:hypothetical protein
LAIMIREKKLEISDGFAPTQGVRTPPSARWVALTDTSKEWSQKVFNSKSGNTFLNIGATYPNQTFTGWIPPASPVNKSPVLSGIEGKHVKITGRIEMYKGKPEIRINAAEQLEVE